MRRCTMQRTGRILSVVLALALMVGVVASHWTPPEPVICCMGCLCPQSEPIRWIDAVPALGLAVLLLLPQRLCVHHAAGFGCLASAYAVGGLFLGLRALVQALGREHATWMPMLINVSFSGMLAGNLWSLYGLERVPGAHSEARE